MKITYISASIIPSTNANSVHVMKMCNGLAKNGHEVILVGTKGNNLENNDVYSYYDVEKTFQLKLADNKLSSIKRLVKGIKYSKGADIIYTRWIIAAIFLILFSNKKIIYEHHSTYEKGLYKFFEYLLVKSKKIQRHVFITNALKRYFINKYPRIKTKDILVLPDGADRIEIDYISTKNMVFDCIYVGSFQKGKGVELVVKLANQMPNLKFAIVGGRNDEINELKKINRSNNIKWFGHLPHNKTYSIIQKSKIALLPNKPKILVRDGKMDIGKWTSPMKLFEYMANRKAIVASNLEVLKEILVDGVNSILVEYDNLNEWEAAIKRLLSDEDLLKKISNQAHKEFNEKYTWKSRAKRAIDNIWNT